jgi:hypothetical protein
MATHIVVPRDDGVSFQNSWKVEHPTGKTRNHTTKKAAINAARESATKGDTIQIHNQDGKIQRSPTYQGSGDDDDNDGLGMGIPGLNTDLGKGTAETGISEHFE